MGKSFDAGKYAARSYLERLPDELASYIPADWRLEVETPHGKAAETLLRITSADGRHGDIALEFKATLTPTIARHALEQLRRSPTAEKLLVAPYISSRTQSFLRDQHISYVDFSGNVYWHLRAPAMFISATSNVPSPEKRSPGRTLSGAKAGRLMRHLCDEVPPFTVTSLAEKLDMDYGNVSRYLNLLERDAVISRKSRGPVTAVDWGGVLRRWSEDYRPPTTERYLDPRGIERFVRTIESSNVRYAISGIAAARLYAPYTASNSIMCYCDDPIAVAKKLDLREEGRHGNILLARPFDDVVYARTHRIKDAVIVAPTQAAIDLLVGHGRELQQADELLEWMKEHEDDWRG